MVVPDNIVNLIMENSRDMIWVIDSDRKPVFVSPAVEEIRGYTVEETLGQTVDEILEKDSLLLVEKIIGEKKQLYMEGVSESGLEAGYIDLTVEASLLHKNGTLVPTETNLSISLEKDGKVNAVFGITRDITDRKRAEKAVFQIYDRFIKIIEKTPFGVFLFDSAGEIIFYNSTFREMLGYSAELLYGRSVHDLTLDEDRGMTKIFISRADSQEWESGFFRKRYVRGNGEKLWVSENYTLFDNDGVRKIFLGLCENINDKVRLELLTGQADRVHSLGQLTGSVSHDLNNMLQVIIGYSDILGQSISEGEESEYLEKIRLAAGKSLTMIKQLLLFARVKEPRKEYCCLAETAGAFIEILKPMIGKDIKLNYSGNSEKCVIYGDLGQLEQLLMNLCLNARDALAGKGSGMIEVSVTHRSTAKKTSSRFGEIPAGRYCCLDVKDNGCGIPENNLDQVFEPFYTTKNMGSGTGLGLSTVRDIAERHNAFIDISSLEGLGTRVSVWFPEPAEDQVTGKKRAENSKDRAETDRAAPDYSGNARGTVLLADDDESVLEYTGSILGKMGFSVIKAGNGLEAVELYIKNQNIIDFMVFDLVMPELNGYDAYQRIRTVDPAAAGKRIVFITGTTDFTGRKGGSGKGISMPAGRDRTDEARIINKPFTGLELKKVMDSFFTDISN